MTMDVPPAEMEYLGPKMKYFVGNGAAGMGTREDSAEIAFLIGPCYTSPNFIDSSSLVIHIDDRIIRSADFEMRRIEKANCYTGLYDGPDFSVRLTDFSLWGTREVVRNIAVTNRSAMPKHVTVEFHAQTSLRILPDCGRVRISSAKGEDTFFCWTRMFLTDWLNRIMEVYFTSDYEASVIDPAMNPTGESGQLAFTSTLSIEPFAAADTAIVFAFRESVAEEIRHISRSDVKRQLTENLDQWTRWCDTLQLSHIPEGREKAIILSSLIMIKSCQSDEGGFMACPFQYCFSYFRDCHGALLALYKAGCKEELKEFLLWAHGIYQEMKGNFNSCAMGKVLLQNLESSDENLASESPSYFCLIAGYYYDLTKDEAFIRQIMASLDIAMQTQMDYIEKNKGHLRFNGDETERYVPRNDGDMYYFTPDFSQNDFSVASLLLFLAAARFYGQFSASARLSASVQAVRQAIIGDYVRNDGLLRWQCGDVDRNYLITNYNMLPIWLDIGLPDKLSEKNTIAMLDFIRPSTGYLPISPGTVEGFTGHTMGMLLSNLNRLGHPAAHQILEQLTGLCDAYGTFSEFYGPGGISNTHNMNVFSSGINTAAMLDYYSRNQPEKGTKQ